MGFSKAGSLGGSFVRHSHQSLPAVSALVREVAKMDRVLLAL